jgi:hypothetical protein
MCPQAAEFEQSLYARNRKKQHLALKIMHFVLGDGFCGGQGISFSEIVGNLEIIAAD